MCPCCMWKEKNDLLKNKYGTLIPQPLLSEKWVFFVKFQIYVRDGNFKYFSIFILGVAWVLLESFQLVYWLKFHIDLCAILIKQVHSWGASSWGVGETNSYIGGLYIIDCTNKDCENHKCVPREANSQNSFMS